MSLKITSRMQAKTLSQRARHCFVPVSSTFSFPILGLNFPILGLVCLLLSAGPLYSQDMQNCLRDYSLLQTQTRTEWDDLLPGATFYLSEAYLENLQYGAFEGTRSPFVFFEYIRPATRKEIRLGSVEEFRRQAVGKDGNIYVAKQARGDVHFFQPNPAFEGQYYGEKGDSTILIPVGLEPVDMRQLRNVPLILEERTSQFLRFDVKGESMVYYLGYPSFGYILDTERIREAVEDKSSLAKALIGQSFLLKNNSSLRFRSSPMGEDFVLGSEGKELKIHVVNAMADRDQVLLITKEKSPNYLVIDKNSDFLLFDADCVAEVRESQRLHVQAESEVQQTNLRLQKLLQLPSKQEWRTDSWAFEAISRRFYLDEESKQKVRSFQYLLHDQRNRTRHSFLSAGINEVGQCWLQSHYASPKGLYHTRVIVYLGEDSLFSSRISALDSRNSRKYNQGWVIETLRFDEDVDRNLLQTIALSKQKGIRIRFTSGGSFFYDVVLSEEDHQQIRDVWMLSEMIRSRQDMTLRQFPRN